MTVLSGKKEVSPVWVRMEERYVANLLSLVGWLQSLLVLLDIGEEKISCTIPVELV